MANVTKKASKAKKVVDAPETLASTPLKVESPVLESEKPQPTPQHDKYPKPARSHSKTLDGNVQEPSGEKWNRIGSFNLLRRDYTNCTSRIQKYAPLAYSQLGRLGLIKGVTTDEYVRLLVDAEIEAARNNHSLIEIPKI